jgi:hypothetical protein
MIAPAGNRSRAFGKHRLHILLGTEDIIIKLIAPRRRLVRRRRGRKHAWLRKTLPKSQADAAES